MFRGFPRSIAFHVINHICHSFLCCFLRFGTSALSADGAEEEAKKKARLARFASGSAKTNSEEEDRRKARAIRFLLMLKSNPPPFF